MKAKQYPSQNEIKEWFEYRDGGLYWKKLRSQFCRYKIGQQAGSVMNNGYRRIRINAIDYREHRLIWIYFNGDVSNDIMIDHINRIKDDNRIENLRAVSRSVNGLNQKSKNVRTYNLVNGEITYRGYYGIDGKTISKSFHTEQEATDWVVKKKSEIFEKSDARGL